MSVLLTFQESIVSEMLILRNFISGPDLICATFANMPAGDELERTGI